MARKTQRDSGTPQALRTVALRYPEVEEGIACKGTALECRNFKARNKAFLFMSASELRLKLRESLPEAARLAAKEPDGYEVGAHGWVKVALKADRPPSSGLLEAWIDESYRLLAPKQLVAMLPEHGPPMADSTATAKKLTTKKPGKA
jgi:hypothetical protein